LRNLSPAQWDNSEAELDQEVKDYLDQLVQENLKPGMSPSDARRCAKVEFGGEEQVKQRVRNGSSGVWLKTVFLGLALQPSRFKA
jgi:hypothetical protein